MPADTQTVLVANGPFRPKLEVLWGNEHPDGFYRKETVSFVDMIRASVFLILGQFLSDGDVSKSPIPLADLEFEFALEGSRRFRAPRNFGLMPFQGSLVASVAESSDEKLRGVFDLLEKNADEHVEMVDTKVAVFHAREGNAIEDGTPATYVTSPRPGLLCVANDRDYLETLLRRMAAPPATVAFPIDLPEWKRVDPAASVFAIRHYRSDDAEDDPSSPLRDEAAANVPDPAAIGLVFECREGGEQKPVVRYLTGAIDPVAIARRGWMMPNEGLRPDFELAAPGVVQISQVVVKPLPASRFFSFLLGYLGHGIYL